MSAIPPLNEESSSVQTHLTIMQGVINRMAENSRSCKVWCVTLVAATLVLVARTGEPQHALIALVPTLLFLFLDSYYLALNQYQGGMCISGSLTMIERTPRHPISPLGLSWVGTDSAV